MQKDFDEWNSQKKRLDSLQNGRLYHEREVWWCSLGINIGSEQNGTGKSFDRPVLILKNITRTTCYVVPLTTSPKQSKYKISIGVINGKDSFALIGQIRLIDTKRLTNKLSKVSLETLMNVKKAIKAML